MAFDFPAAPAVDQVYTHAPSGVSYTWSGTMWTPGVGAATPNPYVLRAGDVMQGVLHLINPNPAVPAAAAHKKYVDETVAAAALYQGIWQVAANLPDLNVPPNAPLNGYSWVAQTVDPNVPETAPASIPGIGGLSIAALDTVRWNAGGAIYELIKGAVGISQMTISDTPPVGGFPGQQWFDSDAGKHYVRYADPNGDQYWIQTSGGGGGSAVGIPDDAPADGSTYGRRDLAWFPTGSPTVPVSDTPPASPVQGMLWFNSADASLYIYFMDGTSNQWVEVSAA